MKRKLLIPSLLLAFGAITSSCKTKQTGIAAHNNTETTVNKNKLFLNCKARDIQTLIDKNISVMLDDRLTTQTAGFFDSSMLAVYYANGNKQGNGGTLAISSNLSSDDFSDIVSGFAQKLRRNDVTTQMIATAELSIGNMLRIEWKPAADYNKNTVRKNQQILHSNPSKQ